MSTRILYFIHVARASVRDCSARCSACSACRAAARSCARLRSHTLRFHSVTLLSSDQFFPVFTDNIRDKRM